MFSALFTGILGLLYIKISLDVVKRRLKFKIAYGPGPNGEIHPWTSAHSNFAAYVPLMVAMLFALESSKIIPLFALVALGLVITLGRFIHYYGIAREKQKFKLRSLGMHMTIWPIMIMSLLLIATFFIS